MLVDTMEYMGQSGVGHLQGGGVQDDAFLELLSNTGLASASSHANGNKAQIPSPELDFGSDDVLPSYDFKSTSSSLANQTTASSSGRKGEGTPGFLPQPSDYSSYAAPTAWKDPGRHDKEGPEAAAVAAVEQTMKKYADNMLRMLEAMTGRLDHLESTTQRLEHLVTDFKGGSEESQGASGGKLLQLENMLAEVQRGVQVLRDRQEIAEAHSQLAKLHVVEREGTPSDSAPSQVPAETLPQSPEPPKHLEASQQMGPPSKRSHYGPPNPNPTPIPPQAPGPPPPPPPPSHYQQLQALPAIHPEPNYQPLSPTPPPPPQLPSQHSMPFYSQQQQQQVPPPPSRQQGPSPPNPQFPSQHSMPFYSQQQQQQQHAPPLPSHQQGPSPPNPQQFKPEAPPYRVHAQGSHQGPPATTNYGQELPSSYGNRTFLPPGPQMQQPGSGGPQMYEHSGGGGGSNSMALPPPYHSQGRPAAPVYDMQMGGSQTFGSPAYRVAQSATPSVPSSGSGGYPRLSTTLPVQHALPTSGSGAGASSGSTPLSTNRVPVDEVIDKVAVMGFSKDQVKAVVRRLTENGQSVDLNIVLDKLMNGSGDVQPQKSWFSRG